MRAARRRWRAAEPKQAGAWPWLHSKPTRRKALPLPASFALVRHSLPPGQHCPSSTMACPISSLFSCYTVICILCGVREAATNQGATLAERRILSTFYLDFRGSNVCSW
jgi:hypothetical protein